MSWEFFIAKRTLSLSGRSRQPGYSVIGTRPIIRIAILSVALGISVMIVSLCVLSGFKKEIRDKVTGFGSHIQITAFDANISFEPRPIGKNQPFYPSLDTNKGISHIQVFATKPGIIKTADEMEGVIIKGVGSDFDWSFFRKNLISGKTFEVHDSSATNDVVISRYIADRLKLRTGDNLIMYFIQHPPRARKFRISGIYETGFEEFDKLYIFADIAHIQKLNDWSHSQVGGFEVLVDDFGHLPVAANAVYNAISYDLNAATIIDLYPQIFAWLELQDMNVIIIITLMLLVSGINMISVLLILILERTRLTGTLKAIGAGNDSIRKIFLYKGAFLTITGLLLGNILGLAVCLAQKYFQIMHLDQASYYVSVVPVDISGLDILFLNTGTFLVCMAMLYIPTHIITRISVVRALRFS